MLKDKLSIIKKQVSLLINTLIYRQKFSYITSHFTYPYVESNCTFERVSSIYLGQKVKFLKGCSILANEGQIEIGDNSTICRYSVVQSAGGKIVIGHDTTVGDFCNLYGQGGLHIGNNVMIASCVQVVPSQHTFDEPTMPISKQPSISIGIRINDDCWIGANVVVLDGVEIGKGAVIGAGSVVTRNVPPYSISVGVPSRVLRFRPGHI